MNFNLVTKFYYKDGTNYTMIVRIPDDVAKQIRVNGLMSVNVYCEPTSGVAEKTPRIEDFLKERNIEGFEIRKGKEINIE
ncbi:MAG: hypothetical protein CMI54_02260 [Parcubacteria group bacterium]|nr:hypothetical protein [Parcubacteria group bacterium]|tara:strand:+ start:3109 stop:3348 length:240 start_codon:yes stop_codon:yes gene_type:complete